MAHLTAHEKLLGRLHAAEARLRLLLGDTGQITPANRAEVEKLTATIEECREALDAQAPRPRRDIDE